MNQRVLCFCFHRASLNNQQTQNAQVIHVIVATFNLISFIHFKSIVNGYSKERLRKN